MPPINQSNNPSRYYEGYDGSPYQGPDWNPDSDETQRDRTIMDRESGRITATEYDKRRMKEGW